jgi:putative membrane protein
MRTLVLCVDRDDDLGEKAKVTSPVVGRKSNLKALIALGIEDPEDSDANVIEDI